MNPARKITPPTAISGMRAGCGKNRAATTGANAHAMTNTHRSVFGGVGTMRSGFSDMRKAPPRHAPRARSGSSDEGLVVRSVSAVRRRSSGAQHHVGRRRSRRVIRRPVATSSAWRSSREARVSRTRRDEARGPRERFSRRRVRGSARRRRGRAYSGAASHHEPERRCRRLTRSCIGIDDVTRPKPDNESGLRSLGRHDAAWPRPEGHDHEETQAYHR